MAEYREEQLQMLHQEQVCDTFVASQETIPLQKSQDERVEENDASDSGPFVHFTDDVHYCFVKMEKTDDIEDENIVRVKEEIIEEEEPEPLNDDYMEDHFDSSYSTECMDPVNPQFDYEQLEPVTIKEELFTETLHIEPNSLNVKASKKKSRTKRNPFHSTENDYCEKAEVIRYKCKFDTCSFNCARPATLDKHIRTSHGKKKEMNYCKICNIQFLSNSALNGHSIVHSNIKPFKCEVCSVSFSHKNHLTLHSRIHERSMPACSRNGVKLPPKAAAVEPKTTGKAVKTCEINPQDYSKLKYRKSQPGDKPLVCSLCAATFRTRISLINHIRLHTGETPYECEHCDKSFRTKRNLTMHTRVHNGERPYKCADCGMAFYDHLYLRSHKKVHDGKKEFICDLCGMSFKDKGILKTHLQVHLDSDMNYTAAFKCKLCPKVFKRRMHLNKHVRIHAYKKYSFFINAKPMLQEY